MNFAPASMHAYIGAVMAIDLDPQAFKVAVVMRYYADGEGRVFMSKQQIADAAGIARSTAFQRLADLAARSIVRQIEAGPGGSVFQLAHPSELGVSIATPVRRADYPPSAGRTTPVRGTDYPRPPHGLPPSAARTTPVRTADGSDHIGVHSGSDLTAELHNKAAAAAADAQAPTHTHEAMPLPVETAGTPELAELVSAWWATQLGQGGRRPGFIVPPAILGAIKALLDKHGAERLRWAIGAAVEKTNQGAPSIAFLTRLCEGGPLPERARPTAPGGYQGAAYKSVNGVAEPREVPEGKW